MQKVSWIFSKIWNVTADKLRKRLEFEKKRITSFIPNKHDFPTYVVIGGSFSVK